MKQNYTYYVHHISPPLLNITAFIRTTHERDGRTRPPQHSRQNSKTQTRSCVPAQGRPKYVHTNTAQQQQLSTPSLHITIHACTAYIVETKHYTFIYIILSQQRYGRSSAFLDFSNDDMSSLSPPLPCMKQSGPRSKKEHERAGQSHLKGGRRVTGRRPSGSPLVCIRG